jgi:hypothetical protein
MDPWTGRLINNPAGKRLWKREYREGWDKAWLSNDPLGADEPAQKEEIRPPKEG